jgi:hypothetical protein
MLAPTQRAAAATSLTSLPDDLDSHLAQDGRRTRQALRPGDHTLRIAHVDVIDVGGARGRQPDHLCGIDKRNTQQISDAGYSAGVCII